MKNLCYLMIVIIMICGCQTPNTKADQDKQELSYKVEDDDQIKLVKTENQKQEATANIKKQEPVKTDNVILVNDMKKKQEEQQKIEQLKLEAQMAEQERAELELQLKNEQERIKNLTKEKKIAEAKAQQALKEKEKLLQEKKELEKRKKQELKDLEKKKKANTKYHRLRIIALPKAEHYHQRCKDIADYLQKKKNFKFVNIKISTANNKEFWVVDVGRLESKSSPEATKLKNKIIDTKFDGIRQFKDPYFVTY